jgi:ABC-type sulfate transport system permease subunit
MINFLEDLIQLAYYASALIMGAVLVILFTKTKWFENFEETMYRWSQKVL